MFPVLVKLLGASSLLISWRGKCTSLWKGLKVPKPFTVISFVTIHVTIILRKISINNHVLRRQMGYILRYEYWWKVREDGTFDFFCYPIPFFNQSFRDQNLGTRIASWSAMGNYDRGVLSRGITLKPYAIPYTPSSHRINVLQKETPQERTSCIAKRSTMPFICVTQVSSHPRVTDVASKIYDNVITDR